MSNKSSILDDKKKVLPKKLEDDLQKVSQYYKPNSMNNTPRLPQIFDDSVEKAMYDEIFGPLLNKGGSSSRKSFDNGSEKSNGKTSSNIDNNSSDFNSSLINRLKNVEKEAADTRRQLAQQLSLNEKIFSENSDLKQQLKMVNNKEGSTEVMRELNSYKEKNLKLELQICEMEKFLADYGLVWVGHQDDNDDDYNYKDNDDEIEDFKNNESKSDNNTHKFSYNDFVKQIEELNSIIYSEPSQVITEGNNSRKARLVNPSEILENIIITFYRNGLLIKRGPFRYCGSSTYNSFVQDILDGYFPSEFKDEYPNGIIFNLKDKHTEDYSENNKSDKITKSEFINKIPKTIIKNGEVINMRDDLETKLFNNNESKDNNIISNKGNLIILNNNNNNNNNNNVQIQIKWIDNTTLLAKMDENDTILDLKQLILNNNNNNNNNNLLINQLEIRNSYPPRVLNNNMTLLEAGLVPNGTVYAKKI